MADPQAERAALAKKHNNDQQQKSPEERMEACVTTEYHKMMSRLLLPGEAGDSPSYADFRARMLCKVKIEDSQMADPQAERAALVRKHNDDPQRKSLVQKYQACASVEIRELEALRPGTVERFIEAIPILGETFKEERMRAARRIETDAAKCNRNAEKDYPDDIVRSTPFLVLLPRID